MLRLRRQCWRNGPAQVIAGLPQGVYCTIHCHQTTVLHAQSPTQVSSCVLAIKVVAPVMQTIPPHRYIGDGRVHKPLLVPAAQVVTPQPQVLSEMRAVHVTPRKDDVLSR